MSESKDREQVLAELAARKRDPRYADFDRRLKRRMEEDAEVLELLAAGERREANGRA